MAAAPLRIFVNYRREDSSGYAGRIYDALVGRSSDWHVFMDIDTIEPGVDFVDVIDTALGSCDVVLAVIGRHWLDIADERGERRLDHEDDYVRLELEAVLERGIRVIPVLVQGARMPSARELPAGLAGLARRNALELTDGRWRYDIEQLIGALERGRPVEQPEPAPRSLLSQPQPEPAAAPTKTHKGLVVAAAAVLGALAVGGFFAGRSSTDSTANAATVGTGGLGVSVPAGWHATSAPAVSGVPLSAAVGIGPPSAPAIVTGTLAGGLSAALRSSPQVVKLGSVEAYRLTGDRHLYLVPRAGRSAVLACLDSVAPAQCDRVAGTLAVSPATSYPLASTARYKRALAGVLATLDRGVRSAGPALRKARTSAAQAAAAGSAASAYDTAARAVAALPASDIVSTDQQALVASLRTAATRFGQLAAAGRQGDARAWTQAASAAARAEAAVRRRVLAFSPALLGVRPG